MTDYTTWTTEALQAEIALMNEELTRRYYLESIPEQMSDLNKQYLDSAGTVEGEEWVQPAGAHDAYPLDWVVTHNGSSWASLMDANVWEPGVSGWAPEGQGEWPMWVQPTGGHDAYAIGAKVSHTDKHWQSAVDANVWEPGTAGTEALWLEQA